MKDLKAAIAHNVFIVSRFIVKATGATAIELNALAISLKEQLAQAHALYGDVSQYFPVDKSLENISDKDFARLSEVFDSLLETKDAITKSITFLTMKSENTNEVKAELNAVRKNSCKLFGQFQALEYKFNRIDFSQYHPINEPFIDITARA